MSATPARWLLALALPLAGCSGAAAEPETKTVTVNFRLTDADTAFLGCKGYGGYTDIGPGASVTIKNGSGDVLGAAPLGQGAPSREGVQMTYCDWSVSIAGVPAGEDFYSAEVASRGAVTVSGADLAADGWTFDVSLGD